MTSFLISTRLDYSSNHVVDVVASLDSALKEPLESATVFKGTSKTVQNELLDCMLAVVREKLVRFANLKERRTKFLYK